MAFITQPSFLKRSILASIKHMVSKSVFKAIDYILSPCCDITATEAWTCTATDVATLVLTLSREVNLLGKGTYRVNVANGSTIRTYTGTFTDRDTITITSVATPTGGGEVTITGNLFLPTNSDLTIGAYLTIPAITSTAPNCT